MSGAIPSILISLQGMRVINLVQIYRRITSVESLLFYAKYFNANYVWFYVRPIYKAIIPVTYVTETYYASAPLSLTAE